MSATLRWTAAFDGITCTYKPEHGGWYEDPEHERAGTLVIPANIDGTPAYDSAGDIDITYYEANGGPCDDRCSLCLREQAADLLREADEWDALRGL